MKIKGTTKQIEGEKESNNKYEYYEGNIFKTYKTFIFNSNWEQPYCPRESRNITQHNKQIEEI